MNRWHVLGLGLVILGGWLTTWTAIPLSTPIALMAVGLLIQYMAVRPMIEAFRRDVGPGRHRRSHWR